MEKQNPPAYGAQTPVPQQVPAAASYPQAVQGQPMQYVQQSPPQMVHQQSYGMPAQHAMQSPQPMAGQPIGHSPSPHAQQPFGRPPQQMMPQQMVPQQVMTQQGVQQPGMIYQKPQMMHSVSSQPSYHSQQSGGIVMQQPGPGNSNVGGTVYQSAVPVATLGDSPAPIDCPSCHQRAMTTTTHVAGQCTHLWALGAFCFTLCLCFVPYLVDAFKDTVHKCSKCGVTVATCKKSGGTQVHAFA